MQIDLDLCSGCGECELSCPSEIIMYINGQYVINEEECCDCLACLDICPVDAIKEDYA